MTWIQIAVDGLRAAGELMRLERHRSSVSRAYFAAFAALTAKLTDAGMKFGDAEAPSHAAVADLIGSNLPGVSALKRRALKRLFRRLYEWRLEADYHARTTVNGHAASMALRNASFAFQLLGVAR